MVVKRLVIVGFFCWLILRRVDNLVVIIMSSVRVVNCGWWKKSVFID